MFLKKRKKNQNGRRKAENTDSRGPLLALAGCLRGSDGQAHPNESVPLRTPRGFSIFPFSLFCFNWCLQTGIETAKNLILAGPKKVVLCDPGLVKLTDLGTNFYLEEGMVGRKSRADGSLSKLKELNPNVEVSAYNGNITSEFLGGFDVVVFCDYFERKQLVEIGNYCHSKRIGFIVSGMVGLYGFCFVDFGDVFRVFDKNGEECKSTIISAITNEEKAIVTCHEDKRHEFEDDDHVVFSEVQGMEEINGKTGRITYLNPFSFKVDIDTRGFKEYKREGLAT